MTLKFVQILRHAAGILLFYSSYHFLSNWYIFQGRNDYLLASASYLLAMAFVAGPLVRKNISIPPARKLLLLSLIVLALPWGEWFQLNFPASREDWSRQILIQTIVLYGIFLVLSMFPVFCLALRTILDKLIDIFQRSKTQRLLPVFFFLATGMISLFLHDRIPLIQDSAAHLFQAKIFANGKIFAPEPPVPDQFSALGDMLVMNNGHWFSMYSPGFPILLGLAMQIGAEWLLCPFLGAATFALWLSFIRRWGNIRTAALFGLLFLFSPFLLLMHSVMMVHVAELFVATAFLYLCRLELEQKSSWRLILIFLILILGVLVRSFSIVAFLLPAFLYVLWHENRARKFRITFMIAIGLTAGGIVLGIYQLETTGNFWTPGYVLEYPGLTFGFGTTYLGELHTPLRALEQTSNNLLGINHWLSGMYTGSLFFLLYALTQFSSWDRWYRLLLFCCFALAAMYFFSGAQDLVIGPRYWFLMAPIALLFISNSITQSKNNIIISCFLVAFLTVFPSRLWNYVAMYTPDKTMKGALMKEIRSSKSPLLIFLDESVDDTFTNWNDPFLKGPVILCRSGNQNAEVESRFPDHRPVFFRLYMERSQLNMAFGYRLVDSADSHPEQLSLFGLGMMFLTLQDTPDADLFDLAYESYLSRSGAESQVGFVKNLLKSGTTELQSIQSQYRIALLHTALLLLLPKAAFEQHSTMNANEFRHEIDASQYHFEHTGEVGKAALIQIDKIRKRIDRNRDGRLEDEEIGRYLALKTRILETR